MSYWKIAWRNMQQRAFASTLTGFSMALGVAAMIAVLVIHNVTVKQFSQDAQGYHLIVGPKGGALQLVLNTVYHLSQPIENIPYRYYEEFVSGRFAPYTKVAIPYCLGDSYDEGGMRFRVVGTTPDMFEKLTYGRNEDGTEKKYEFSAGRNFKQENFFEAIIGSVVAAQTDLKVGSRFNPTHGISNQGKLHDEQGFEVVGILEPTGTANDRALFVNMEGFYLLGNHALSQEQAEERLRMLQMDRGDDVAAAVTSEPSGGESSADEVDDSPSPLPEGPGGGSNESAVPVQASIQPLDPDLREVTAILVLSDDLAAGQLQNVINEGAIAQAVFPVREVYVLLERIVGPIQFVLFILTLMIVVVAGVGILVSIYNSMNERSRDIAVMRALGASRTAVMSIVLIEAILLSMCGGGAGILLGHGLMAAASPIVEARTGVSLGFFQFDFVELLLLAGLLILAPVVGFLPAWAAYRTDVAKALAGSK